MSLCLLQPVDCRNVRVVECREQLRLTLESRQTVGVARKRFRQDLERDLALQPRIARAIDLL